MKGRGVRIDLQDNRRIKGDAGTRDPDKREVVGEGFQLYGSNANGADLWKSMPVFQPVASHGGVGEHACADSLYRLA